VPRQPATEVTIELLTGVSGDGWWGEKGEYRCPPRRAKMLIKRGYARALPTSEA
jgi:hypothetical protein